jgi:hypothetical protein
MADPALGKGRASPNFLPARVRALVDLGSANGLALEHRALANCPLAGALALEELALVRGPRSQSLARVLRYLAVARRFCQVWEIALELVARGRVSFRRAEMRSSVAAICRIG